MIPQIRGRNAPNGVGVTVLPINRDLYYGVCDVSDVGQGNGGGNGHGERGLESTYYKEFQRTKRSMEAGESPPFCRQRDGAHGILTYFARFAFFALLITGVGSECEHGGGTIFLQYRVWCSRGSC